MRSIRNSRLLHDRQAGRARAICTLVAPLTMPAPVSAGPVTDMRTTDTAGQLDLFSPAGGSGAATTLEHRGGGVESAYRGPALAPSPATTTTPGSSPSTTATRTTTTRTTRTGLSPSAACTGFHGALSYEALVEAWLDCRRTKRNTPAAQAFEARLEHNLHALHQALDDGSYRPGQSICFVITRPKHREVWAAGFADRVVHHLLYRHIGPAFETGAQR